MHDNNDEGSVTSRSTFGRLAKQVRLVSAKAECPNHPSRGGGQPAGGGGVLHDNDNTCMTPLG